MLHVEQAGPFTTVQDLGRPGLASLGVSPSGAFDRAAAHQANALVGNRDDAAVLEVLAGGLVLRVDGPGRHVAVTGAAAPALVDGRPVGSGHPVLLRDGQRLRIGRATHGARVYLAVAGGLLTDRVLGSRSADTLSGLGGGRVPDGARLPVGEPTGGIGTLDVPWLSRLGEVTVDLVLGPRDDWFTPSAVRTFLETAWTVSAECDRVGVRLVGPALERSRSDELPSEPCVRGSVQVAADGLPIVFGPDHPVTGGYPVVGVVVDHDTDRLAQLVPGDVVRFRAVPAR